MREKLKSYPAKPYFDEEVIIVSEVRSLEEDYRIAIDALKDVFSYKDKVSDCIEAHDFIVKMDQMLVIVRDAIENLQES